MKMKSLLAMTAIGLLAMALTAPAHANEKNSFELGASEAKQTWRDFKPAPSKIKTNFGTLDFTGTAYPNPKGASLTKFK